MDYLEIVFFYIGLYIIRFYVLVIKLKLIMMC